MSFHGLMVLSSMWVASATQCEDWCNVYTCPTSRTQVDPRITDRCADCPICAKHAQGEVCEKWCNEHTCFPASHELHDYCKGCDPSWCGRATVCNGEEVGYVFKTLKLDLGTIVQVNHTDGANYMESGNYSDALRTPEGVDHITDNLILARGGASTLFNLAQEDGPWSSWWPDDGWPTPSPKGAAFAYNVNLSSSVCLEDFLFASYQASKQSWIGTWDTQKNFDMPEWREAGAMMMSDAPHQFLWEGDKSVYIHTAGADWYNEVWVGTQQVLYSKEDNMFLDYKVAAYCAYGSTYADFYYDPELLAQYDPDLLAKLEAFPSDCSFTGWPSRHMIPGSCTDIGPAGPPWQGVQKLDNVPCPFDITIAYVRSNTCSNQYATAPTCQTHKGCENQTDANGYDTILPCVPGNLGFPYGMSIKDPD